MNNIIDNLVLITSVINVSNNPLSYSKSRSIFNANDRFEQTKKTIQSIKNKIPNCKILIVECSNLSSEYEEYLIDESDYFLNLYSNNNIQNLCNSKSKSIGEGIMTINAFKYINELNLSYKYLYKISGRYWLSDSFDYNIFNNNENIVKKINNNNDNIFTALLKLNYKYSQLWCDFLKNSIPDMKKCIGYEILFGRFIKLIDNQNILYVNKIGLEGFVSVCGSKYIG